MRFSIFKQHKNKTFNYTPRFYDERKERLNNLKKKYGVVEGESDLDNKSSGYSRVNFRDEWKQTSRVKSNRNSRLRFMIIFLILLIVAFIILQRIDINILNG